MKRFAQILASFSFILLLFPACAQQHNDFEKTWKEIESFKKQGLPQSAIKLVDQVYNQAKADKNQPQLIKAMLYKMSLQGDFEEDHLEKAMQQTMTALQTAQTPEKEIMHSLLAQLIQQYYNQNQWKILQRTTINGHDSEDIQTWDAMQFEQAIQTHYLLSLENRKQLEALPLKDFQAIVTEYDANFWPTIYDLLANRALLFFTESTLDFKNAPEPLFQPENPYFADAHTFVGLPLDANQLGQNHAQVLELFQRLLAFHLTSNNSGAFINLNLRRLTYVYQQSVQTSASWNQYANALSELIESNQDKKSMSNVYYTLAELYYSNGQNYQPQVGDSSRFQLVESARICRLALEIYTDSAQKAPFDALHQQILQKSFSLTTEEVILPGKPILASLGFKNVNKLYFKVVRLDVDAYLKSNVPQKDQMKQTLQQQEVLSFSRDLPDTKDHQGHTALISIPALNKGFYALFICNEPDFSEQSEVEFEPLWVSELSYILKENSNTDGGEMYVLDRVTGKQVPGVDIEVYQSQYNNKLRIHETVQVGQLVTNKAGFTSVTAFKKERYGNYTFVFRKGEDVLISRNYMRFYKNEKQVNPTIRTYLFTDRSIYRPGQTMYYKGIVVSSLGDEVTLAKGQSDLMQLYSPNGKKIMEIPVVTDAYGAFQGSIQIPQDQLNGSMNLRTKSGNVQVMVEEYKRPAFLVILDTVAGQYSLNDSIRVTGKVENYAGNAVTNAFASYRVTRSSYWPIPYRSYGWIPPYLMSDMQIVFGELTSDDQGAFSLKFKAITDPSAQNRLDQFYQYTVSVRVTDITGEVHDAQTSIRVGSVSALLDVKGTDQVNKEAIENFSISASNLSGSGIKMEAEVTFYQLNVPEKVLFSTPFGLPDQEVMSEQSYRDQFPDLAWKEENKPEKWTRNEISNKELSINGKATISLGELSAWPVGEYVMVIEGNDQYGKPVKAEHYFSLYSSNEKTIPGKPPYWAALSSQKAEPGQTVTITVGSAVRKANMLVEVSHGTETLFSQWVSLSGGLKTFEIPVKEAHRGGILVNTCMVINNRLFTEKYIIDVPFTNKKLDIVLETRRDFLTPGEKETWKVHIKGADGKALASRLMAGMYDASLDQFTDHTWNMSLYHSTATGHGWEGIQFQTEHSGNLYAQKIPFLTGFSNQYPNINWFGYFYEDSEIMYLKSTPGRSGLMMEMEDSDSKVDELIVMEKVPTLADDKDTPPDTKQEPNIPLRTNFNETAFFYPDLSTDKEGNVTFSFKTPDALTTWKLLMLAYTPDLKVGTSQKEFKAKKSLMVMPNVPRFVRQNDELDFTAKVVNMTDVNMRALVTIEFFDPITGNKLDLSSDESSQKQELSISPGQGTAFNEKILIPGDLQMLGIRTTATDGTHTDGEERVIPVLTNRVLVTETMPMNVKANEEKEFEFLNLVNTGRMKRPTSAQNYRFTLEFTSNPAWYAIQALPSIAESVDKSTLSVFNRYMANAMSSYIVNSNPIIKQVFDSWKQHSPEAFFSNLQKNEDLKYAVLSATPWVLEAEDEATQKQRIASLFDLNQLVREKEKTMALLQEKQLSTGAWPWFDGMRDDRYTTQAIVLGMAKLDSKGVLELSSDANRLQMIEKAVKWLDQEMADDYDEIKRNFPKSINDNHLSGNAIQYLYTRSLLIKYYPIPQKSQKAVDYFVEQARKYWLKQSNYLQGMLALALPEFGYRSDSEAILRSLMERALVSDEMGMYWHQPSGWNWYEAPVETQSMLIEAFSKLQKNLTIIDQMKMWLLKQKQTSKWSTSSATAEAVYALLMTDGKMLDENVQVEITVAGQVLDSKSDQGQAPDAGTGYFRKSWAQEEVSSDLGEITVKNPNNHLAWGAAYWQYFEQIDKVIKQQTSLSVDKKLFLEMSTDSGLVLMPVEKNQIIKTGDKLVVRLVMKTDRNLEFVHLSDTRATGLEPVSNLSGYMYSGGLGYYHQITDVGSDFFIRYMQKGTYVLEYRLYVTQKGAFVDGMATIQSMYAPEFAAHSAGGKIVVE